MVQELRRQLASAISDFKAYDVPAVCSRLGLADGTGEEAFNSKFKYASNRIQNVKSPAALGMARQLLDETENYSLAEIVAKVDERDGPAVTELTRRRIMALFDRRPLASQIDHVDLLKKIWPVEQLPSAWAFGSKSLLDDVIRHTVRNDDWSNPELLQHLGFLTCSRRQLFRFLEEVTGPIAQLPDEQTALVAAINNHLQHDGYRLTMTGKLSGTPIYTVQTSSVGSPADHGISAALAAFNPNDIHARWTAAVDRRGDDPQGAITLARTLLEDVCLWILDEAGEKPGDRDDLPALYRRLAKLLRLAPDDHTEQAFKQLLGSCQQIVELLGALRTKLGDAHSAGPKKAKAAPRHAELAVNLSGTMATFLIETWKARQAAKASEERDPSRPEDGR
jgi:hypothetical protein